MLKSAGFLPSAIVLAAFLALGAQAQTPFPFFDDLEDGDAVAEAWSTPENSL